MTRHGRLAVLGSLLLAVAACSATGGGSTATVGPSASASGGGSAGGCPVTPTPSGTPEGWDVSQQHPTVFPQIINPAGTITCGSTRLMFSFLDDKNVPVAKPDRTVQVKAYDLGADPAKPVAEAPATFIWAIEPQVGVYVADLDLPTAGTYGVEFTTAVSGGAPEVIRTGFDVQPTSSVVAVGDKAPPSDTPTLADVGGDISKISSDPQPVKAFYEWSVAQAVADHKPFVLAFATPKFCVSKQCGPTLDRIKPIAARHPDVTVINVEPYKLEWTDASGLQPVMSGDPPQLTPTQSTLDWKLPTEPWVFVVDKDGIVRDSFMLIFSDEELENAIKAVE
jgi:hypothetical protein